MLDKFFWTRCVSGDGAKGGDVGCVFIVTVATRGGVFILANGAMSSKYKVDCFCEGHGC